MSIVEYTRTRAYCLVLVTIRNISRGYNVVKMPVYSWLFATITSTSMYAKHSVHPYNSYSNCMALNWRH